MSDNLTEDEFQRLESAKTPEEWEKVCDEIEATRNGQYPSDWYKRVVLPRLLDQISRQFKE